MGIIRICFMAVKGLESGFRPEDCCSLPLQTSVVHLRRAGCGCRQVAGEVSGFFEMGFGFNCLIRKRNSVDMEPAAVNKSRDKFLFLQVCEVQYSNPSDIFRRVPVAKGDGAGADRLSGYGDLAAGIWPQRAGGLFGAAGKSKPPRDFRLRGFQCPGQESNLHALRHTHLKRARLPIPPPGHCTGVFRNCGVQK